MIAPTLSSTANDPSSVGRPFQCADCSADDPQWASLNKGVLICSECCYVHRNLGRHVSQVRSLKKGIWDSNQLELMYVLYSNGSNNIWEHSLLDPQNTNKIKRKPTPRDPVLPTKENFIKAKYAQMAFALRPSKDDSVITQDDLNRQLWSCVRTAHVETTLRLLVLGADPNYIDRDKGNSPLHVAAKEGQSLQVELLWIYGADAGRSNAVDLTPSQVAKLENHNELCARLEELQFEVTNRLTMYLCGRRPDHSKKQYFLIPELIGQASQESPMLKTVRKQLRTAPASFFERITQDVYDEVDRRETMAAWNATMQGLQPIHLGNDQCVAVFLPPNHEMSAIRNQLRQKLAKCGPREFAMLIIDVLNEAKRRFVGRICLVIGLNRVTSLLFYRRLSDRKSAESGNLLQGTSTVSVDDFLELKEKVLDSETKLSTFQQSNTNILRSDIRFEMRKLQDAHTLILTRRQPSPVSNALATSPAGVPSANQNIPFSTAVSGSRSDSGGGITYQSTSTSGRPALEALHIDSGVTDGYALAGPGPRSGRRHGSLTSPSTGYASHTRGVSLSAIGGLAPSSSAPSSHPAVQHRNGSAPSIDCTSPSTHTADVVRDWALNVTPDINNRLATTVIPVQQVHPIQQTTVVQQFHTRFPESLICETELLTRAIKSLLSDAQCGQLMNRAPDHAHSIALSINRIWNAVPDERRTPQIDACLRAMSEATVILSAKCNAPMLSVDETCSAAYAVAKSAKQLLVNVHRSS
ncbi:unnamed protein product [Anisakis simplex]|uniref:Arf-GAP domain-containing protein n=1 Tax=Anisakis simplex TaxID=6269 RepID=A0A158PNP2_ANISI|nr:unnamed protein product [Anisakis simplex]